MIDKHKMTENNRHAINEQRQRNNILFHDLAIKREKENAHHTALLVGKRKFLLIKEKDHIINASQEAKAAYLAYMRQHLVLNFTAWNRTKEDDIIFIRRESQQGYFYQTFEKDAAKTAKILGLNAKKMKIGHKTLDFVSIPEQKMQHVINTLSQRDLGATVINKMGQKLALSQRQPPSPTLSPAIQPKTPKLDVMETLERNRQDGRQASIHVENLAVWADSKGNWKVSGMVNGQTVTAKSIEQADAFSYKKGEMTSEQLAAKYNLQETTMQQTSITRRNTLTRRYSLGDN